jgi:hypothetical protein
VYWARIKTFIEGLPKGSLVADIGMYVFIHLFIYVYMYVYTCIYICIYIYMNINVHIHTYIYMYINIYIYICICIHKDFYRGTAQRISCCRCRNIHMYIYINTYL